MKIIFFQNIIPDPCGAFFHDVTLARALQMRGHHVLFVTVGRKFPIRGVYRGIPFVYFESAGNEIAGADLLSSAHYPIVPIVRKINETYEKPLLLTMHYGEDTQSVEFCPRAGKWSEFLWFVAPNIEKKVLSTIKLAPSFVETHLVRPTFIESDFLVWNPPERSTGEYITLINANMMKGLDIFVNLARRMPERKFLGVKPYYNVVKVPTDIPNIKWIDLQEDIKEVLKQTRILLVPSAYESWGRVAFEAMYNGIPVIYTKPADSLPGFNFKSGTTQGMKEWIGDAAIECDRTNIEEWITEIGKLDDKGYYNDYSDRGYKCTRDMDILSEIPDIEKRFYEYASKHPAPVKVKGTEVVVAPRRLMMPTNNMRPTGFQLHRPQAPQAAPQAQQVQQVRQVSALGLPGGRFGMRR